jgi:hypothetical protein
VPWISSTGATPATPRTWSRSRTGLKRRVRATYRCCPARRPFRRRRSAFTSGAPGNAPGLNHDGGAAATLPAAPAGTKVLTFRLDAVEDAELRLLAAEKPTVSPD